MTKKAFIKDRFDIKNLTECGFFVENATYEQMERRICEHYGLYSIFMFDYILRGRWEVFKANIDLISLN